MNRHLSVVIRISLMVVSTLLLTSCYRFPEDHECSVVPATNHPDITRNRNNGPLPGGTF